MWPFNSEGHFFKEFIFKDFKKAFDFAQKIAELAEKHNHHPILTIEWGKCSVELWTHESRAISHKNCISKKDLALISEIDKLTI